jgi:hypothetical protein
MRPTILEGDVVLVNRLAYDFKLPLTGIAVIRLGEPKPSDEVPFTSPADGLRLIKRLIAIPGDREQAIQFLREQPAQRSFGPHGRVDPIAQLGCGNPREYSSGRP